MRITEVILPEERGKSATLGVEKRLAPRDRTEPEAVARLHDEGTLLRLLGGRVTPRLVAAGDDDHGPWLRMEKVAFPTLALRLEGAPLAPAWVARAARAAFAALAELHEAHDDRGPLSIVHADLSPANLAVDDEGSQVVLLDLELASWRDGAPRDGAFRGTVGYCAPEIARGETPTVASDLFALAATLLHAVTGVVPRDGPSLPAVLAHAAEQPLVVTGPFDPALAACLAHDAAARPASARAVLALLPLC
jgi:serine/threonine protein kinase